MRALAPLGAPANRGRSLRTEAYGALSLAQNLVGCDFPPHKYGYLYGSSVELAADPG
jgi:hypothetical protein